MGDSLPPKSTNLPLVLKVALSILIFSVLTAKGQVVSSPTGFVDFKLTERGEDSKHDEDVKYWRNVFENSLTNFSASEFESHLSGDGRGEIFHHLHYDEHIATALLHSLTDFSTSCKERCDGLFNKLSETDRTNQIVQMMRTLSGWYGSHMAQIAGRPEIDRALVEKLLSQAKKSKPIFQQAIHAGLARNTNTPIGVLEMLSENKYGVRLDLLCNPNLPTNIVWTVLEDANNGLAELSKVPETNRNWYAINTLNPLVGQAKKSLASRNTTQTSVLAELAKDANRQIRAAVGRNTNAPTEMLLSLTKDSEAEVRIAASQGLAMSPKTPADILENLAKNGRSDVRASVARNPVISRPLLEELLNSESYVVWTAAFRELSNKKPTPEKLLRERLRKTTATERRSLAREKGMSDWAYRELSNQR